MYISSLAARMASATSDMYCCPSTYLDTRGERNKIHEKREKKGENEQGLENEKKEREEGKYKPF